jgi:FixJ family two-component response regulator
MYDALRNSLPTFTQRQIEVIELIAAGCSNDEVGERLGISPRTAKAHATSSARSSASRGAGTSRWRTALSPATTRSRKA